MNTALLPLLFVVGSSHRNYARNMGSMQGGSVPGLKATKRTPPTLPWHRQFTASGSAILS